MEEGLLSLKWNNHKSTFFQVLSVLRQKLTFTDVTVACEGRLYPAHKFVLSACSEYFSEVFGSIAGTNLVVVLKDVRRADLEYLLDYMYLGQVDVAQSELASLIKTAECLRIKGLAIPDDEPHKTRTRTTEEQREGSPPAKRKRHLPVDEDRGVSSISGAASNSALSLRLQPDPIPSPVELNSLRQTEPRTPQTPTSQTSIVSSKQPSASLSLPHTPITSQSSSRSPTVPTTPTTIPVIKQEAADPADTHDVFEGYEDGDTKPVMSDGAIPGPSGLQGSSDAWDADSDLGGFAGGGGGGGVGGEGYNTEAGLDEHGDGEVQGAVGVPSKSIITTPPLSQSLLLPNTNTPHVPSIVQLGLHSPPAHRLAQSHHNPSLAHLTLQPRSPPSFLPASPIQFPTSPNQYPTATSDNPAQDLLASLQQIGVFGGDLSSGGSHTLTCPYCGKISRCLSHLQTHLRTHTGERPFACTYCPFRTTQKVALKEHIYTHTGEKPHSCPLCDFRCAKKCNLNSHIKRHHPS